MKKPKKTTGEQGLLDFSKKAFVPIKEAKIIPINSYMDNEKKKFADLIVQSTKSF
jgi:hypothetical protein